MYSKILGTGSYLPSQVRSNADLEKMVDTSDDWIVTRTGIRERRIAAENETVADMGAIAAQDIRVYYDGIVSVNHYVLIPLINRINQLIPMCYISLKRVVAKVHH